MATMRHESEEEPVLLRRAPGSLDARMKAEGVGIYSDREAIVSPFAESGAKEGKARRSWRDGLGDQACAEQRRVFCKHDGLVWLGRLVEFNVG